MVKKAFKTMKREGIYSEISEEVIRPSAQECAQNGLIVESAGIYGNVIRFLCPLVVTDEQLEAGLDIFENAVAKLA